ncbi:MAG: alanine dehydrogenase [Elusimicrobia bacterium]|nr:alanine dehydrogenase [Elusimicrobiota bacterium]
MIVGLPKEIKDSEYRVGMVPAGVEQIRKLGHRVLVEKSAGIGTGISDAEYKAVGAEIISDAKVIFDKSDMIIKVKEPLPTEYKLLKEGQIVFTYFHFAASKELTLAMMNRKIVAIAYETIRKEDGETPLLVPMSEVAGKMSIQEGAKFLERPMMGRGILLGGVPGVAPAKVVIIGGGVAGTNAAKVASGLGAKVSILDVNLSRLRYLSDVMLPNVVLLYSNSYTIKEEIKDADLVVGSILIPGAKAPRVITKKMLKTMKKGSVIVDIAIDQGGCTETSKPTTHKNPVYVVDGVVHYCVANMPGAVAGTSTYALTNATIPYALEILKHGYKKAALNNKPLSLGINIVDGKVICKAVGESLGLKCYKLEEVF